MEIKNLCIGGIVLLLIICVISAFSGIGNVDYEQNTVDYEQNTVDYEQKTIELFESGTTITAPAILELTNTTTNDMLITKEYDTFDRNLLVQAIKIDPSYVSEVDTYYMPYFYDKISMGELQDNGLYKVPTIEGGVVYMGIVRNDSIGETIVVGSTNETYAYDIVNSVNWGV